MFCPCLPCDKLYAYAIPMDALPIIIVFGGPLLLLVLILGTGIVNITLFGFRVSSASQKQERPYRLLEPVAAIALALIAYGLFLLTQFFFIGGPNQGISKQLLYMGSSRYVQMQVGLLLVVLALAIAYIGRFLVSTMNRSIKKSNRTERYVKSYGYLVMIAALVGALLFVGICYKATHQSYAGQVVQETCNGYRIPVAFLQSHGPHEPCLSLAAPYRVGNSKLAYYLSYLLLGYILVVDLVWIPRFLKNKK